MEDVEEASAAADSKAMHGSSRVVNLSEEHWQEYRKDGLSDECIDEQLKWSRMHRPLLDGGEGKQIGTNMPLKSDCHDAAAAKECQVPAVKRLPQGVDPPPRMMASATSTPSEIWHRQSQSTPGERTQLGASSTSCCGIPVEGVSHHNKDTGSTDPPPVPNKQASPAVTPMEHKQASPAVSPIEQSYHRPTLRNGRKYRKRHQRRDQARAASNNSGLQPPRLANNEAVTGKNKEKLRKENKKKRLEQLIRQHEQDWWTSQQGQFSIPVPKQGPSKHRGGMCPSGLALHHPAAELLLDYATKGCPAKTGLQWSKGEIAAAVEHGNHSSAEVESARIQFRAEAEEKQKLGMCRIVDWDDIKDNPPAEMKVSPLSAVPHKSRLWRAILDLSYALRLEDGTSLPSVNEASEKTGPSGAVDQLGHSLQRIIHAFATAPEDAKVFSAKWDVKDGFWRVNAREGEEWNFCYVLPRTEGQPIQVVVPTSLQMGWIESPTYFCAASETARDVSVDYIETPVGSLPPHKFEDHTKSAPEFEALPSRSSGASNDLRYMVEVYVDDFIGLAIPTTREQLDHVSRGIMHGIHDVFPPDENAENDAISYKKVLKGESQWALVKDILGFTFDGDAKTLWLEEPKRDAIITVLKGWIRSARDTSSGIPFKQFQSIVSKIRHAFIAIPSGKGLLSPCNDMLRIEPNFIYLHRNKALLQALKDMRTLLQTCVTLPTKCTQLVTDWPEFVGVKDASKWGVGGVIIGEKDACTPTLFRYEWPQDIRDRLVSEDNPAGDITNSDLEMAGLLLLFVIMEEVCGDLQDKHVALYSDNSPTVSWVRRLAARSPIAAQLVRALALRLKCAGASPLTPLHIAGSKNAMTDIPSRSFGSNRKWHCESNEELLTLFNASFPLPNQSSWTVYQPSPAVAMKVTSILRTQDFTLAEWSQLPGRGSFIGEIGSPMSSLFEWTLTYRTAGSNTESDALQGLPPGSGEDSTAEDAKLELRQSVRQSQPLARRLRWTQGGTP